MAGTDSAIVQCNGPALQGVYLHDPDNPAGTIRQFFFAPAGKQETRRVASDMLVFAGRTRPVAEFGENETDMVDVEFVIPFDLNWSTTVAAVRAQYRTFKAYVYRDNRGRSWFGVVRQIEFKDTQVGTNVAFTFERTYYSAVPSSLPVAALEDGS